MINGWKPALYKIRMYIIIDKLENYQNRYVKLLSIRVISFTD